TAQDRLSLPPFREVLRESFVQALSNPSWPLTMRSRIYRSAAGVNMDLLRHAWPRLRAQLATQAQEQGYEFEAVFPPPPGAEEAAEGGPREARPEIADTIERQ